MGKGIPRFLEVIFSFGFLLATSPLLLVVAIAIRVSSRGPALFRQERMGRQGRTFLLYKLRTMRTSSTGPYVTAEDDHRITPIGRLLRKWKLDELPEFWNVLRGDMSLVGPRPETPLYVEPNDPEWMFVLQYRPGLTDPVTLRLRNEETLLAGIPGDREKFYREVLQPFKLRGYVRYLHERTWRSDFSVLWQTGLVIVFPQRVSLLNMSELADSVTRQSATSQHPPAAGGDLRMTSAGTGRCSGTT
ncbi:MAG TPA: sugar transferase [Candidatus Acidoferrales bacterium]|nr:sugar transferase [Candidatus Acidoferrales bacterium]